MAYRKPKSSSVSGGGKTPQQPVALNNSWQYVIGMRRGYQHQHLGCGISGSSAQRNGSAIKLVAA